MRALAAIAFGVILVAGHVVAADESTMKEQKDKVSYSIGFSLGSNLKNQQVIIDPEIMARGLKDAYSGAQPLLPEKDIQETMMSFQKEMLVKQKATAEKNRVEGEAFLFENKKKEGVVTLPSGLQYKILNEGSGRMPSSNDTVTVNYRGTLIDGTEFDSSFKRNAPASFQVKGVIRGWSEALQLMKEGSKWQLFIPSNLAYGERGAGPQIGPNSTLIFEVELLSIKASEAKEPAAKGAK